MRLGFRDRRGTLVVTAALAEVTVRRLDQATPEARAVHVMAGQCTTPAERGKLELKLDGGETEASVRLAVQLRADGQLAVIPLTVVVALPDRSFRLVTVPKALELVRGLPPAPVRFAFGRHRFEARAEVWVAAPGLEPARLGLRVGPRFPAPPVFSVAVPPPPPFEPPGRLGLGFAAPEALLELASAVTAIWLTARADTPAVVWENRLEAARACSGAPAGELEVEELLEAAGWGALFPPAPRPGAPEEGVATDAELLADSLLFPRVPVLARARAATLLRACRELAHVAGLAEGQPGTERCAEAAALLREYAVGLWLERGEEDLAVAVVPRRTLLAWGVAGEDRPPGERRADTVLRLEMDGAWRDYRRGPPARSPGPAPPADAGDTRSRRPAAPRAGAGAVHLFFPELGVAGEVGWVRVTRPGAGDGLVGPENLASDQCYGDADRAPPLTKAELLAATFRTPCPTLQVHLDTSTPAPAPLATLQAPVGAPGRPPAFSVKVSPGPR